MFICASASNAGDRDSIPGLKRSPGEGKVYPLQYSGLENSMDCTIHGIREWDMTEQLSCHYTIQNISQLSLVDPYFYSFTHALFFLTSRVLEFLLYSSVFQIPLHYVQYILFEVVFIYSLFLKDISHDIEF